MAVRFSDTDVLQEVKRLQPRSVAQISSLETAEHTLSFLKSAIARLISADPDSLFAFLLITQQQIVARSELAVSTVANIVSLLSSTIGRDSVLDEELLYEVSQDFRGMGGMSYREKKYLLTRLKTKVSRLVDSSLSSGGRGGLYKDPKEARRELRIHVSRLAEHMGALSDLHGYFKGGVNSYLVSGLVQYAADQQLVMNAERIEEFLGYGGVNVSRALIAAIVGLANVNERLTVRNWYAPKYDGTGTILAGSAPYTTSGMSLPYAFTTLQTVSVTVSGDAGTLTIPRADAPTIATQLQRYYPDPSPPGMLDRFDPAWPSFSSNVTFKILENNTPYEVTMTSVSFADPSAMRGALQSALTGAGSNIVVGGTGDSLQFSLLVTAGAGSRSRLAIYEASNGVSINTNFDVTFTRFGQVLGRDTVFSALTLSSFSTDPILSAARTRILASSAVPGVSGSKTTLALPLDHATIKGDSVQIGKSWYHVESTTATEMTLTSEILYPFDGINLDTTSSVSFVVWRQPITVTNASSAWGSEITNAYPNSLDFPQTPVSQYGVHTQVTLDGSLTLGSPLRIGDILVDNSTYRNRKGMVQSMTGSAIDVLFDTGKRFDNNDITIISRGALYYTSTKAAYGTLEEAIDSSPPFDRFESKVNVYLGSGQNRGLVDEDLLKFLTLFGLYQQAYSTYQANTVKGVSEMMRYLGESRLTAIKDLLASSRFLEVGRLRVQDLSEVANMAQLTGQVISGLDGGSVIMTHHRKEGDGPYTDEPTGDNLVESPLPLQEE